MTQTQSLIIYIILLLIIIVIKNKFICLKEINSKKILGRSVLFLIFDLLYHSGIYQQTILHNPEPAQAEKIAWQQI